MKRKELKFKYSKKGNVHTYENIHMVYRSDVSEYGSENYLNAVINTKYKTVNIYGYYHDTAFDKVFRIGDYVEYDSYNLVYTAPITKIGPKTITVTPYPDSPYPRNIRMDLNTFIWRNHNLDLESIFKRNQETSRYI